MDDGYYWIECEYGWLDIAKKEDGYWLMMSPFTIVPANDKRFKIVEKVTEPKRDS